MINNMGRPGTPRGIALFVSLFVGKNPWVSPCLAWQQQSSTIRNPKEAILSTEVLLESRRAWLRGSAATVLTSLVTGTTASASWAVEDSDFQSDLKQSLRPPTQERPQISLPSKTNGVTLPPPTQVQALIALGNPQVRPLACDVLVVQVFDGPARQTLLGGAKIAVARIRFPIQVQMDSRNAAVASQWNKLASSQDLWIVATICSSDDKDTIAACLDQKGHSTFQASGISKLLTTLPGWDDNDMASSTSKGIRPPASLILRVQ